MFPFLGDDLMKKMVFAVVALPFLAACQTTSPEVRLAEQKGQCSNYGFKEGSDAYASCMMQLDIVAKQQDRERQRAIGEALSEMGNSMQSNRPVTCNTYGTANRFGSTAYGNSTTTCY